MFKEVVKGFSIFFSRDKIIIFIALIVLGFALFSYNDTKTKTIDRMEDGTTTTVSANPSVAYTTTTPDISRPVVANPSELLPNDSNSQWSALNPVGISGNAIIAPDVLSSGSLIGVVQSLKNANLDLRPDFVIPKQDVGPWNNSTILPNTPNPSIGI